MHRSDGPKSHSSVTVVIWRKSWGKEDWPSSTTSSGTLTGMLTLELGHTFVCVWFYTSILSYIEKFKKYDPILLPKSALRLSSPIWQPLTCGHLT